ncbi:hypothetical protein CDL15_Pgr004183 [Punica granatum]|uniref:Uncharacterized protein n=1 Tax=Punica granatum TaxID=22663 RepID=A0A218XFQ1_PUNGR|nr:hypothetical protein CDL15_Pgr004183 [Punica granatum]
MSGRSSRPLATSPRAQGVKSRAFEPIDPGRVEPLGVEPFERVEGLELEGLIPLTPSCDFRGLSCFWSA